MNIENECKDKNKNRLKFHVLNEMHQCQCSDCNCVVHSDTIGYLAKIAATEKNKQDGWLVVCLSVWYTLLVERMYNNNKNAMVK